MSYADSKEQYRQTLELDPTHLGAKNALARLGSVAIRPRPVDEPAPPPEALDLNRQKKKVKTWMRDGNMPAAEKRLFALLRTYPRDSELHDLLAFGLGADQVSGSQVLHHVGRECDCHAERCADQHRTHYGACPGQEHDQHHREQGHAGDR